MKKGARLRERALFCRARLCPRVGLCAWRGSCRASPSARQAAPALGKGCRCAAVSDGCAPSGSDGRAGVFDSAPASAKTIGRPGRSPAGLVRPSVLGASWRAEGGRPAAQSRLRWVEAKKRKSEGRRTPQRIPHTAHGTPRHTAKHRTLLDRHTLVGADSVGDPAAAARSRQAPIADRVGSHQSDGQPNGGRRLIPGPPTTWRKLSGLRPGVACRAGSAKRKLAFSFHRKPPCPLPIPP